MGNPIPCPVIGWNRPKEVCKVDIRWRVQALRRGSKPPRRDGGGCVIRLGHAVLVMLALSVAACGSSTAPAGPVAPASGEWREFEGSWNAAGSRRTIALGADRKGAILDLRGSMLLAGPARPGIGFRAEVIALSDSETGLVGRGIWTDENGDHVYSTLEGEGTAAQNRITGTILGGTGRYAGVTGSYEFSWRFVLETEDGAIQGSAIGLKGRVRAGQPDAGGARP